MLTFDFHSPEQELFLPLYAEKQVRVFVKRDDLIHPYISGNKWRKLKYPFSNAFEKKQDKFVTFGGAWSNHLLATACAGATFGFRTYGFVRGEDVNNPVLALCKLFGMELEFVSRSAYQDKNVLYQTLLTHRHDYVYIAEGGYSSEGAAGCADLITELRRPYNHIFCAAGTGTTVAGLSLGLKNYALSSMLHAVPVLKGGTFITDQVRQLHAPIDQLILHTDYHFGGYAKTDTELLTFIKTFVAKTGILIEPTYTGKLFFALHDLIAKNYFSKGEHILVIHTGGLTGFLGMYEKFKE